MEAVRGSRGGGRAQTCSMTAASRPDTLSRPAVRGSRVSRALRDPYLPLSRWRPAPHAPGRAPDQPRRRFVSDALGCAVRANNPPLVRRRAAFKRSLAHSRRANGQKNRALYTSQGANRPKAPIRRGCEHPFPAVLLIRRLHRRQPAPVLPPACIQSSEFLAMEPGTSAAGGDTHTPTCAKHGFFDNGARGNVALALRATRLIPCSLVLGVALCKPPSFLALIGAALCKPPRLLRRCKLSGAMHDREGPVAFGSCGNAERPQGIGGFA